MTTIETMREISYLATSIIERERIEENNKVIGDFGEKMEIYIYVYVKKTLKIYRY